MAKRSISIIPHILTTLCACFLFDVPRELGNTMAQAPNLERWLQCPLLCNIRSVYSISALLAWGQMVRQCSKYTRWRKWGTRYH